MWQYNLNEAQEQTAAAHAALDSLAQSTVTLDSTMDAKKKLEVLLAVRDKDNSSLSHINQTLQALLAERDKERKTLSDTYNALASNYAMIEALLAKRENDNKTLAKDLKDKTTQYLLLEVKLSKEMAERNRLAELALVLKKDYDDAKAAEAIARRAGGELEKLLEKLRIDNKDLTQTVSDGKKTSAPDLAKLAENARLIVELNRKIEQANLQLAGLEKEAAARGIKLSETNLSLQDAVARGNRLETQVKQLRADLKQSQVRSELLDQESARLRNELTDFRNRFKDLTNLSQKELELARALVDKLKAENLSLNDKFQLFVKNVESRFAGIVLSGNRVIFVVDMSGSMGWKDGNTIDPDKWPLVCETVGKLMLSLPEMKQFQIIMFSTGASFPLGNEGRWLDFEGQKTVDMAVKKLKSITPEGGTNIHAAFTEVFKYRSLGLDTVYFFSDGLPTSGEGLPKDTRNLSERQRTEILSTYLRNTVKNDWNRAIPGVPRVRINTIGFFYESPDVGSFLWALAREHDGSFVGMSRP